MTVPVTSQSQTRSLIRATSRSINPVFRLRRRRKSNASSIPFAKTRSSGTSSSSVSARRPDSRSRSVSARGSRCRSARGRGSCPAGFACSSSRDQVAAIPKASGSDAASAASAPGSRYGSRSFDDVEAGSGRKDSSSWRGPRRHLDLRRREDLRFASRFGCDLRGGRSEDRGRGHEDGREAVLLQSRLGDRTRAGQGRPP